LNSDFLVLTAELAVAIGGFSGVIVALEARGVREWTPVRRRNLRILLQLAALALLFSLLPLGAYRLAERPNFWRWALGLYGIAHVVDATSFIFRQPPSIRFAPPLVGLEVAALQLVVAGVGSGATAEGLPCDSSLAPLRISDGLRFPRLG
jgi:hypothetical protein